MNIPSLDDTSDVYSHIPLGGGKVLRMKKPKLDLMPSAADRWMTCAASPRFCLENSDLIPADLSSKFSQEGTTAHEVAAAFLQDREPDPKNCPTPIDAEMRMHGWNYAEYVQELRTPSAGMSKLIVEQKQPLFYYEGRNAVVDAAVINPDSLHIVDYKYGAGVPVSPIENRQCTIYARQTIHHEKLVLPLDFPVFVHIYQPRCRGNEDSPAQVWETNVQEIMAFSGEIADHAQVIQINHKVQGQPLAFAPSEKACRWCPAKAFCPARQQEMLDGIEALDVIEKPEPAVMPMPAALSVKQLAAVLKHKSSIEKWLKDAEAYAEARLNDGHAIPGFKLVLSRGGNRKWSDPEKAAELLGKTILKRSEYIEETVITPAAAEKLLGKKKFSAELTELITNAPGVPTIAPVDDEREECTVRAEHEFVAIPENADFE
jgi:hypothetical protein